MYDLMERAGQALFSQLNISYPAVERVLVVVGTGNNGGDGYVLGRLAQEAGLQVDVASVDKNKTLQGDAQTARQAYEKAGGKVLDATQTPFGDYELLVDGLLGTGLQGPPRDKTAELIETMNDSGLPILAIDIPSGLHADTGEILEIAIAAHTTMTFVAVKAGLTTGDGKACAGNLFVDGLGITEAFQSLATARGYRVAVEELAALPPRWDNAHKGQFGRLLCIGGNKGMGGAIRLSAEAALRCGAGLVKVYCHHQSLYQVSNGRPELMVSSDNLSQQLDWADVIVLGPGLGQDGWSKTTFEQTLSYLVHENKPVLVDADGLNLWSQHLHKLHLSDVVITPHPAEAARLLHKDTQAVQADRFSAVSALAAQIDGSCVLKGAGSLISSGANNYVCADGNPGMATAGMGDVLSGVIGALLAQGLGAEHAAVYGVCLHAAAGDLAAENGGQRGILASDLFTPLRQLIN